LLRNSSKQINKSRKTKQFANEPPQSFPSFGFASGSKVKFDNSKLSKFEAEFLLQDQKILLDVSSESPNQAPKPFKIPSLTTPISSLRNSPRFSSIHSPKVLSAPSTSKQSFGGFALASGKAQTFNAEKLKPVADESPSEDLAASPPKRKTDSQEIREIEALCLIYEDPEDLAASPPKRKTDSQEKIKLKRFV
jgi:hypothetical protein